MLVQGSETYEAYAFRGWLTGDLAPIFTEIYN
jgi:hypothetical protein